MMIFLFLLSFTNLQAAEGHGAHTHGMAELKVVQAVQNLRIRFEVPGESSLGFEHEASTKEQIAKVNKVKKNLKKANIDLIGGECKKISSTVEYNVHGGHGEFQARYLYECLRPLDLKALDFNFLKDYPSLKEVEISFVSKDKQLRKEVSPKDTRFNIR